MTVCELPGGAGLRGPTIADMEEPASIDQLLEGVATVSLPPPRRITVLFDESMSPFLMVAATVFESTYAHTEQRIEALYEDMVRAYYLDDLKSYERHKKKAFHASEDPVEVRAFFINLLAGLGPLRIFIQYTDHRRRPDLGPLESVAVLYRELIKTVLQGVRSADEVTLIFETHQDLDSRFEAIVRSALRSVRVRSRISVSVGQKRRPYALAVSDYAMQIFSHWQQAGQPDDPKQYTYREWRAIRGSISMVRSLEEGTIVRRGLPLS